MDIIQLVDKWILEHGSATLSKEVAAELRQKVINGDAAHAKALQELQDAQAKEIARLKERHAEELKNLERAMAALRKEQEQAQPQIGDAETSVIRILASAEDGASDGELVRLLNTEMATVNFYLGNLKALGLAQTNVATPSRGNVWKLTPPGEAYAARNNLVGSHPEGLPRRQTGFARG